MAALVVRSFVESGDPVEVGLGVVLSVAAPLFILLYSYGIAIKMDKLINGFIIGDTKKRR